MSRAPSFALAAWLLALPILGNAAPRTVGEPVQVVLAELPGKPTGPIAVDYRLAAEPAVGVPLKITITARVEGGVGALRLETSASVPNAVLLTVPSLVTSGDGGYAWELTVVPLTADAGYLNVIVAGEIDGVAQARSVSIPLRTAAAAIRPEVRAEAGTETLIALPVRETP